MTDQAPADDPASRETPDPAAALTAAVQRAIDAAYPEAAGADPVVQPTKPNPKITSLGDFQANAAMALAKRLGAKPRDVASAIVERLRTDGAFLAVAEPVDASSIAGPGFINFTLRADALAGSLAALDTPELGLPPAAEPETVVVDLCGVNLAKQMHVGHLRSTVIGDSVARVFERLGHRVIRQNHVGDWGLPIAMVVGKIRGEVEAGRARLETVTLPELNTLYRRAQAECSAERRGLAVAQKFGMGPKLEAEIAAQIETADERLAEAKSTLVALQSGEAATLGVWETIYRVTMSACLEACARLGTRITDEASAGESSYRDDLAGLVEDLASRGVAEESDGALVVRVEGLAEPCIVRKSDGGYLYATTDLAAIRRRVGVLGASRVAYFVDARQALHFRQVFGAAHKAGYDGRPGGRRASLEHGAFGTMLGEDGRPFKTRSGENVRLSDLIDEAEARARAEVASKNPDLPAGEAESVAGAVAIAALKYADLSTERVKDYVFSFDRMMRFEGNTGPYLLYALVRVRSIFRKAAEQGVEADAAAAFVLGEAAEKQLALVLLRYPGVVRSVAETLEPHRLTAYLYELAGAFSGFFEKCPVLRAEDTGVRSGRLRLCGLTGRVLADGLGTLGIPTVERM